MIDFDNQEVKVSQRWVIFNFSVVKDKLVVFYCLKEKNIVNGTRFFFNFFFGKHAFYVLFSHHEKFVVGLIFEVMM